MRWPISNAASWHDLYPESVIGTGSFILEGYIDGTEYALDAYFDEQGRARILNVLRHDFASAEDTSDRMYVTSAAILRDNAPAFVAWLDRVNALVGAAGLRASYETLAAGKVLALANKESLVVGGEYVMRLAAEKRAPILPIDSEHSAIFQCLAGEQSPVRRLIITCSGGALRDLKREELAGVTAEQALRHPQWEMGAKITIDSSTLVNKGFEVIEAHWLFGTPAEKISVVLHPQSIIHSMVEFEDGAIKAQLGTPDMRMPISLALMYPRRANRPGERFDFLKHPQLTFAEVDRVKYPALDIAYDCLRRRGTAACTMNGANEVAVAAFLGGRCAWLDIVRAIEHALNRASFAAAPTLADYAAADGEARRLAAEFLAL